MIKMPVRALVLGSPLSKNATHSTRCMPTARTPLRALVMRAMATLFFMGVATQSGLAGEADHPSPADYQAAGRLLGPNLRGLVRNETVEPHWIGNTGKFWYRRDGENGSEFVVVAADGSKSPAFGHAALSRALAAALGEAKVDTKGLPPLAAHGRLNKDLTRFTVRAGETSVECDLTLMQCHRSSAARTAEKPLMSPLGNLSVVARNDNLFIIDMQKGTERQLTTDGAPYYSWSKLPDDTVTTAARQISGEKASLYRTYWSPDGRYLIAPRVDERKVAAFPVIEWVPANGAKRPVVHESRLELPGDRATIKIDYFLFDLKTGRRNQILLPQGYEPRTLDDLVIGWSQSRGQAFLFGRTIASKSVALFRYDFASNKVTQVIEESAASRVMMNTIEYSGANVRILGDGEEIVWFSERDGWGHLYLYNGQTGALKSRITQGNWLVVDVENVDPLRRHIYFTASGREKGDPYYRYLYRAGLDGKNIKLLTPAVADHHFDPNYGPFMREYYGITARESRVNHQAGVFVDTWSTVDEPPVSVLRSTTDGRLIAELEKADATRLYDAGWKAPVRERVKAADKATDLYAVYYAPYQVNAGDRYALIDAAYGGPQIIIAPRNFTEAYRDRASAYTRLGFGVVQVDGRGTPMRSRAFRDAGYPYFTAVGIADHVAAIQQVAARHAEIDTTKVGIIGHSWGGLFAAQAIMTRGDFYKVAISSAGVYDYAGMYAYQFDNMIGAPIYANGTPYRDKIGESPVNWQKLDVTALASNLRGKLLIIYGDLDENVPPSQAFRLVDALSRANKPYDLLYGPNRNHRTLLGSNGYVIKRTWDYFIEHLQGREPAFDAVVSIKGDSQ